MVDLQNDTGVIPLISRTRPRAPDLAHPPEGCRSRPFRGGEMPGPAARAAAAR